MNTIINQNLNSGNNSIDSLNFYWMAEFKDKVIFQFRDGIEHRFKEVLDHINELEYFHLYHKDRNININFIVDLKKGFIKTLDAIEPTQIEEKKNIRLIYFRRNKVEISTIDLKETKRTIEYHLGFQWLDKLDNNRKIILIIDNEGNWVLGE